MNRWVEIAFDCLPLRTITRLDIPIDASPAYQQRCERINRIYQPCKGKRGPELAACVEERRKQEKPKKR